MIIFSKRMIVLSFGVLFSLACSDWINPLNPTGAGNPDMPTDDLAGTDLVPPTRCLAARGLAGTLLKEQASGKDFCINFDSSTVSDATLKASGWLLTSVTTGCDGFSIEQSRLTFKTSTAASLPDCQARLPVLLVPSGTTKIVVALIHTLNFTEESQYGRIDVVENPQTASGWSGIGGGVLRVTSLEFSPTSSLFKGALHARNTNANSTALPVWQIQSIAVLGM